MTLKIFNTLSGEKEAFKPLVENQVKMYVCGMTVYDYCHLGHARVLVAFDVITRYLRSRGYGVTYVRNITDVDDKIFNRANERGIPFYELTDTFIQAMHEDEKALSVLRPDIEPRATAHIEQIIDMIQVLVDKGVAYAAENGDVYYAIDQFPEYGKLSKQKVDELLAGARVETGELKKSPLDFALWKSAKDGEASWSSPWGDGRPGWHIECSAMSTCCLGDSFDIHGGGPDLKFPHHENEIAQSEGATGKKYVNYWMHAGAIRVNKEKMSKSLGNFFTIREVLEKHLPEVVRYFLVASHYRSQVDYSEDSLKEAKSALDRLYQALRGVSLSGVSVNPGSIYQNRFNDAMDDDFNTPEALAVLFELAREVNRLKEEQPDKASELAIQMVDLGKTLGILQLEPQGYFRQSAGSLSGMSDEEVETLIVQRSRARQEKDFAESDRIRDLLKAEGIELDDRKGETTWRRV